MKIYSTIIISICIVSVFLSGCGEGFLNPNPAGKYTEDNYFKSEQDAINAVSGIYAIMLNDRFTGHDDATYDACSDDIYNNGDHLDEDIPLNRFTVTPTEGLLPNAQWQVKYEMISRANLVITNVPDMDSNLISEEIQNRCLGEACFFRAYAHWWLYLVHGEIPVINEEDVKTNNYNKPKNTIDEVLFQIEADLTKAADLLPETNPASESGRVHKGTAWGYLTQLYMHWSCYPGKDEMLDRAIAAGNHIIGNPNYRMMPDFSACFQLENGNTNTEMLLQMNGDNGQMYLSNDLENGYFWSVGEWGGWPFWQPTKNLVDAFGNDPRKAKTILVDDDIVTFGGISKEFKASYSVTGYSFRKNAQYKVSEGDFTVNLSQVFPLMRSSDVYLLVAEAKIRKGQSGDSEINEVRQRVGLPPLIGATKDDLIKERRLELAGECRRFFDLVRWDRIGWVDIVSLLVNPDAYNGISRSFQRPKHYFFPLPQGQIDKTKGVLVQNPAYL
ncbi:MAG: RagB/SusD family nutrient uptake outer membrane protein [Tannerella sp.]|jgi:hypothetical protein|nr:RagB/SusD family nutrient uptake outer membrane protein [Tannerella sp.]